jgi:hypothetical protein
LRQDVQALIAPVQADILTEAEAHEMAHAIRQKGPQALLALLDCLFDEDRNRQRVALMILTEIKEPLVARRVHELLQRPDLSEKSRSSLLTLEALDRSAVEQANGQPAPAPSLYFDSLLEVTEDFWDSLDMEDVANMWLEHFIEGPADNRLLVLHELLAHDLPKLLGVARLEIAVGDLKILNFLAEKLGEYSAPLAARMLEDLLVHPDLVVRTLAERSLTQCRERVKREPPPAPKSRFYRAHLATDEWDSHYSLVYSVRGDNGLIKFFVVLIDRCDRGIIDCWGRCRYTEAQFRELLAAMTRDFADLRQRRIAKPTALTLLRRARLLNVQRRHRVPLSFHVWLHTIENERFREDAAIPDFGIHCSICQKPIRTGPRLALPFYFGPVIVCPVCARRNLRCATCGGSTTLPKCLVVNGDRGEPCDLKCPHCFESFHVSG